VARHICRMIDRMPDAKIPVTWENIIAHTKKKVGHRFNRQVLPQKKWNGRKLIAEAFSEAKEVRRQTQAASPRRPTSRTATAAPGSAIRRAISGGWGPTLAGGKFG
jgi:hypothetical protein